MSRKPLSLRRTTRLSAAIALAWCALAPLAHGAEPPPAAEPAAATAQKTAPQAFDPDSAADQLVRAHTEGYFTLVERFEAPLGLTGYLLTSDSSQPVVLYTDPAGTHLFVGAIITAAGENVATPHLASYLDAFMLPSLFERLAGSAFLEEGKAGGPAIYVLFDPRCPHCADLHQKLRPGVEEGRVAVRWVPVDVLGDEPLAAAVLDRGRGGEAAAVLGETFAAAKQQDASAVAAQSDVPEPSEQARAEAAQNAEALQLLGAGTAGVPQILYRANSGSFQVVRGSPTADELELILRSAAPVL